jgi:DNA-binding MarR family transcriptional regulator
VAHRPPVARTRELAVALHDLVWLLPRALGPQAEEGLEPLPPSELEVMRLLVRRPALNVGEVARELGLRPSNASAAIRGLLARGLLERRADARDARISRLAPTRRAHEIRRRHEAAWGKLLRERLRRLPPEDADRLLACVDSLTALAGELSAGE